MDQEVDNGRRNFLKGLVLLSTLAVAGMGLNTAIRVLSPPPLGISSFPTLKLVDSNGNPIKASSIPLNSPSALQFDYPLQNTPNFLLNIGDSNGNPIKIESVEVLIPATGEKYLSLPGVGPNGSIVAYNAICQHLGCIFPELRFYPAGVESVNIQGQQLTNVIHCLCHGSTYDPVKGASVVTGPTTHPLPQVKLIWDSGTDELYASLMIGPVIYGRQSDLVGEEPISGDTTTVVNVGNPFIS